MSTVRIQLFGAMRKHGDGAAFELPLEAPCTLSALRERLSAHLDPELLRVSAFGTDEAVLTDQDVVTPGQSIAVLPPVCGG